MGRSRNAFRSGWACAPLRVAGTSPCKIVYGRGYIHASKFQCTLPSNLPSQASCQVPCKLPCTVKLKVQDHTPCNMPYKFTTPETFLRRALRAVFVRSGRASAPAGFHVFWCSHCSRHSDGGAVHPRLLHPAHSAREPCDVGVVDAAQPLAFGVVVDDNRNLDPE